jgi:hypothetical protein
LESSGGQAAASSDEIERFVARSIASRTEHMVSAARGSGRSRPEGRKVQRANRRSHPSQPAAAASGSIRACTPDGASRKIITQLSINGDDIAAGQVVKRGAETIGAAVYDLVLPGPFRAFAGRDA